MHNRKISLRVLHMREDTNELIVTQWHHIVTKIWVNISSDNGLLPDGTKPFTWTNIDISLVRFCHIHLRAILHRVPEPLFCIMSLKNTLLILQSHFQRADGLDNQIWFTTFIMQRSKPCPLAIKIHSVRSPMIYTHTLSFVLAVMTKNMGTLTTRIRYDLTKTKQSTAKHVHISCNALYMYFTLMYEYVSMSCCPTC